VAEQSAAVVFGNASLAPALGGLLAGVHNAITPAVCGPAPGSAAGSLWDFRSEIPSGFLLTH
jgi:hypothetical protein